MSENKTVKLRIRTPCLAEGKLDLEVDCQWTVLRLKQEIQKEWPNHPSPPEQRLIYSGKLLDNKSVLNDALRFEEGWSDHTIHLVCKNSNNSQTGKAADKQPSSTSAAAIGQEGLRHRSNAAAASSNTIPASTGNQTTPATTTGMAVDPSSSPLNLAAENWQNYQSQLMMQQYYAQYIQYMQYCQSTQQWSNAAAGAASSSSQVQPHAAGAQMAAPLNPVHAAAAATAAAAAVGGHQQQMAAGAHQAAAAALVNQQQQAVAETDPAPAAAAAAAAAADNLGAPNAGNVMMNAGAGAVGAMEDDDDEMGGGRRDIFDWFYVLSRVLVLFSVVYSYSSLARFALIAVVAVIFYLYKLGFLGQHRQAVAAAAAARPQQQAADQAAAAADQQQPENQERQAAEEEVDPTPSEGSAAPAADEDQPQQVQPWHDLVVTFVTTFFTSMVPDNNDPQVF